MDIFAILETFGLPVAFVIGLAFYIRAKDAEAAKQAKWIQSELQTELRESFTRLEGITIKLIEQQKLMQINQAEIRAKLGTMIEVRSMMKGDDYEKKFLMQKRKDL